jgi:4-hydroxy-3-polyprenylbenzoate decarboxylase
MSGTPPIVVGITGASGAPYAVRLLQQLIASHRPVSLIVSKYGMRLLETEAGIGSIDELRNAVGKTAWDSCVEIFSNEDRGASPASGSSLTAGMIVCPCSMGTLSAIAVGASRSLIERAGDVTLKERRKLILVPRETPLSAIHLANMLRLARAGAVVMPASPGFYNGPKQVSELVDFMVARMLDHLGVEQKLVKRWDGDADNGR